MSYLCNNVLCILTSKGLYPGVKHEPLMFKVFEDKPKTEAYSSFNLNINTYLIYVL